MQKLATFSLWCDFVEREFLVGEFREMIQRGEIKGATSNPAIFANAILTSKAYKNSIENLKGKNAKEIYENLAFSDIKSAAVSLLPLWERDKNDGYISIEIDPTLCDDAGKSIDEGRRIFETINMPNVMIKVPATEAGFEVMNALYKDKINVNATLIFSTTQTKKCLEAFECDSDDSIIAKAVISVFVSRFDRYLESQNKQDDFMKKGSDSSDSPKLGIYNAMKCYEIVESYANPHIRTLFASTGVKGDSLPASYYVYNLLLKNSINTAPLHTIKDFIKRDSAFVAIPRDIDEVLSKFDVENIARKLLDSGLEAFKIEFENLLKSI